MGKLPCRGPVVWSWCLKECFALPTAIRDTGFLCSLTRWWNNCLWLPLPAWYGCMHAHAWGTGQDVGWCMCASSSLRSCSQRSCPGSKGSLRHKFAPFIDLMIMPWWWACPWLPLTGWYGCMHAWGTGQVVGWCLCTSCDDYFHANFHLCNQIKFILFS